MRRIAHLAALAAAIGVVAIGIAAPTGAQRSVRALERELIAIELELAAHYRTELELALAAGDLHGAGLALRAWRGHVDSAARLMDGVLVDEALHARLALHARALAIEGRVPRELADDVRALDEAQARLAALPREITRA
ncbi:MAG TPA: hypothetical protein VIL20_06395 [Sandaracinaceae bacterium]